MYNSKINTIHDYYSIEERVILKKIVVLYKKQNRTQKEVRIRKKDGTTSQTSSFGWKTQSASLLHLNDPICLRIRKVNESSWAREGA